MACLPRQLRLLPAFPNPFNPSVTGAYELPAEGPVRLEVLDMRGRRVRVLVDGPQGAGRHRVVWDGTDSHGEPLPSGVYLVRLRAAGRALTEKLTLLR